MCWFLKLKPSKSEPHFLSFSSIVAKCDMCLFTITDENNKFLKKWRFWHVFGKGTFWCFFLCILDHIFQMFLWPVTIYCGNSYRGFPQLDAELYPLGTAQSNTSARRPSITLQSSLAGQLCPYSPMTRRTKQEVKAMQKLSLKQVDNPSLWSR